MTKATDDPRWTPQPAAAALVKEFLDGHLERSPELRRFAERLRAGTGTRLGDWVDAFGAPVSHKRLAECGFEEGADTVWRHRGGIFPAVRIDDRLRLFIRVESVEAFIRAQGLKEARIEGEPGASLRRVLIPTPGETEFWALERHGYAGFHVDPPPAGRLDATLHHAREFGGRRRDFDTVDEGYAHARKRIAAAAEDLGADLTADLFFAAERDYWQGRNKAARIQKARQDALGLGWANHDHHTYRSGRVHFTKLIGALEALGMACRERFYAGREAGWGAQVMEQPVAGIVVFADVDLDPGEVSGDFAHEPLEPSRELGTVGLWCRLHGEAFLEAGMHHLECRFDFTAARDQLTGEGAPSMNPFTDLPVLKQCFTEGERWPVAPERVEALKRDGLIDAVQAERFLKEGALGSHLEILQRDEGYKGFNQEGVSDIIRKTDPRGD